MYSKSLPAALLFCGILCFSGVVSAQKMLQPKEKREYAMQLLQKYNADGWKIIRQVDSLALHPPFDRFAEGDTEFDVRNAVGTMVHEMNHSYGALLAWKMKPKEAKNHICYYLSDDDRRLVRYTPVFPTEQMGKTIPKHLRTFRFETYIFNAKEKIPLTSNVLGIYGLLDEWVAYYQGTLTDVKMHCWYEENTPGNAEDWYDYFSNVGSAINAHQEFKFYCLAYLLHARKHQPDMYKAMMQNQEMVETLLKVNELFGSLLLKYDIIKENVFGKLRAKGVKIVEDDEWIFLNRYGAGNYLTEYKVLEKEMAKPAYQQMLQNLKTANRIALYGK